MLIEQAKIAEKMMGDRKMKIELSVYVDEEGAVKAYYEVEGTDEITDVQKELCYNRLAEVANTKIVADQEVANHKVTAEANRDVAMHKESKEVERHIAVAKTRSEVELAEMGAETAIRKLNYEADTQKREMISTNHTTYLQKMSEVHEIILDKTEAQNHTALQALHSEVHTKFLDAMKKDE